MQRSRMALFALAVAALLAVGSGTGRAAVWKRERADGVVEFTNVPRAGRDWRKNATPAPPPPEADSPGTYSVTGTGAAPAGAGHGGPGAFWFRERTDGVVEFTNLPPIGARWRVLFRTGPGKAGALRGTTDRVPARDVSPERYLRYEAHIRDQQAFYGIPPALVRAVIKTESDFDPHVVSSVGAMGLMQLMPDTARLMGVTDIADPRQNIMGGSRYLQTLAQRFCRTTAHGEEGATGGFVCSPDEEVKVLAGYHAGPGAVDKYGGLPPYETTRQYVTMVLARYEQFRRREAEVVGFGRESKR